MRSYRAGSMLSPCRGRRNSIVVSFIIFQHRLEVLENFSICAHIFYQGKNFPVALLSVDSQSKSTSASSFTFLPLKNFPVAVYPGRELPSLTTLFSISVIVTKLPRLWAVIIRSTVNGSLFLEAP